VTEVHRLHHPRPDDRREWDGAGQVRVW
jgi:hypothetical protein